MGIEEVETIDELVKFALTDKLNKNKVLQLSIVTCAQSQILNHLLGIDVSDYTHTIDVYSIKHIIKQHSNVKSESSRGQVAVTIYDFKLIPTIISNPDTIAKIRTKLNKNGIMYSKKIADDICFLEEVRSHRKQLAAVTLYKRKTG